MSVKEFFTGYKGKNIPKELNEFNWGAFLLTFFWGIPNKAWITLLAIPLIWFQLPFGLNWILFTILQFYCGFKGNMWAYQNDWWMAPKDFRKKQAAWGLFAITINILFPIVILMTIVRFAQKSPDNPVDFIKNTQCVAAYSKLKKEFYKVNINNTTTEIQIAEDFAKHFKDVNVDGSSVNFKIKSNGQNVDIYHITFNKYSPEKSCNLLEKNCVITSSFIIPAEISFSNHCQFYFDNNKNFEPDEETKKSLDKGYNIFKYL